jgi:hypothetical protein
MEDSDSFMGAAFGDVATDIGSVVGAVSQGASNVITSIGDAKAGGGLSKTIGDTAVKIGVGVGVALVAYALLKRR